MISPSFPLSINPHKNRRHGLFTVVSAMALAALLVGCAGQPAKPPTSSEDLRTQARAAFLAQDYPRTLAIAEPQALIGVAWAQYTLGYMYYYGRGVTLDRTRARDWIERAAAQDYAPAKEALRRARAPEPPGTDVFSAPAREQDKTSTPAPPSATERPAPSSGTPSGITAPPSGGDAAAAPPPVPAPPGSDALPPSALASPVTEKAGITKTFTLPSTQTPAELPPASAAPDASHIRSNAWIASQDPRRLTLQLIGSRDRNAVLRYIREQEIGNDAAYYGTTRDGETWYVVIYGNYPDRDAAQAALLALPPALRAASPWIRQFGDIRAHLSAP